MGRGRWGFSWGLKERDVGGSNGGGGGGVERAAASWWRGRWRGGEGSGLEAKGFRREREAFVFCMWREMRRRGGGGGNVEEKAVAWRLRDFNVRERERERHLYFVFLILFIN